MATGSPDVNKAVARFPQGVTNVPMTYGLGSFLAPSPTKCHVFFDDFNAFDPNEWSISETQAGATQALTSGNGGLLLLTNTAANNDVNFVLSKSGAQPIVFDSTKKCWFQTRFKLNTVTNQSLQIGVGDFGVGTNYAAFTTAANETLSIGIVSGGVSQQATAIATLVDDTFVTAGYCYDGAGTWSWAYNGVVVGHNTAAVTSPAGAAYVYFGTTNNSAAAHNLTVDYIFFAQER